MEVPSFVGKACLKLKGLCVNVWTATLATCQEREDFDEKVPPRAFRRRWYSISFVSIPKKAT
ncbi:Protein CBG09765 [Caenorhabditis briggsae]|uniref:Protein CBG09765 n=1 Tax=Caenorhabditis briggsae TaxID=6238 RepID=A8X9K6_CAEBR|nr:Protein CBG09765 [Caenorhabditis briggsae]CAP29321.1 Protein CBG09765 [Caenorhabditis briggsae]